MQTGTGKKARHPSLSSNIDAGTIHEMSMGGKGS